MESLLRWLARCLLATVTCSLVVKDPSKFPVKAANCGATGDNKSQVEWLDVSTFQWSLCASDGTRITIFLDSYVEKRLHKYYSDVHEAEYIFVGHSHDDHILYADEIALQSRAKVIGSRKTAKMLQDLGVPKDRLIVISGGEQLELAPGIHAEVIPSLHSCIWANPTVPIWKPGADCCGCGCGNSEPTGGTFAYSFTTPEGTLYYADSAGFHSDKLIAKRAPDVAILGLPPVAGCIDGQVTLTMNSFVYREVELLQPRRVIWCHFDPVTQNVASLTPTVHTVSPHTKVIPMKRFSGSTKPFPGKLDGDL